MTSSNYFDVTIHAPEAIWALTLAFTLWAAWLDWNRSRVPNWLTVPVFFLGIGVHSVIGGWHGMLGSIEGAGLGLAVLFPLVLLRGLGAGDWKLMGAVGALLGPWPVLGVLFVSVLAAGVMSVAIIIRAQRVAATFRNMVMLVQGFFIYGWRANPVITIDNPRLLKLPFGVATAVATLTCFLVSRWAH
jgi:prepilin peptidase CpaA